MSRHTRDTDEGESMLLRRTVIKLTGAGAAFGAAGGFANTVAAQEQEGAEIVLGAQETNGYELTIESATLPDGGFIALVDPVNPHEKLWPEIGEGMPSEEEAIESQTVATTDYLESGTHEGVELELDEPLDFGHNVEDDRDTGDVRQKLYQAWLYRDPNGDEEFQNVEPGGEEIRYTWQNEDQHPTEVDEIHVGEAYLEFVPVNPNTFEQEIQERDQRIEELESENEELRTENERLRTENERLRNESEQSPTETTGEQSPGLGVASTVLGAGGAAALLKRLQGDDDEE